MEDIWDNGLLHFDYNLFYFPYTLYYYYADLIEYYFYLLFMLDPCKSILMNATLNLLYKVSNRCTTALGRSSKHPIIVFHSVSLWLRSPCRTCLRPRATDSNSLALDWMSSYWSSIDKHPAHAPHDVRNIWAFVFFPTINVGFCVTITTSPWNAWHRSPNGILSPNKLSHKRHHLRDY